MVYYDNDVALKINLGYHLLAIWRVFRRCLRIGGAICLSGVNFFYVPDIFWLRYLHRGGSLEQSMTSVSPPAAVRAACVLFFVTVCAIIWRRKKEWSQHRHWRWPWCFPWIWYLVGLEIGWVAGRIAEAKGLFPEFRDPEAIILVYGIPGGSLGLSAMVCAELYDAYGPISLRDAINSLHRWLGKFHIVFELAWFLCSRAAAIAIGALGIYYMLSWVEVPVGPGRPHDPNMAIIKMILNIWYVRWVIIFVLLALMWIAWRELWRLAVHLAQKDNRLANENAHGPAGTASQEQALDALRGDGRRRAARSEHHRQD
jgi:hypothetical protein